MHRRDIDGDPQVERDLRDTATRCNVETLVWILTEISCESIYEIVGKM